MEEGDTVEIISGVFEGSRALVMRMPHDTSSSEEVIVRLLQEETPITIKIHGDYLKLVEKKKKEVKEEALPEVKATVSEEEIMTDLEKMITFDDEIESELEGEYADYSKSDEIEVYGEEEEDEEEEEEDEWAKFDGF